MPFVVVVSGRTVVYLAFKMLSNTFNVFSEKNALRVKQEREAWAKARRERKASKDSQPGPSSAI